MWYVRRRPPVLQAFANLWGVQSEDLIVSFDGCCAFRPPSVDVRQVANQQNQTEKSEMSQLGVHIG